MSGKLNKHTYEQLIQEDIEWLERQPHSLERMHIIAIVQRSAFHEYPEKDFRVENDCLRDDVVELREALRKIASKTEHDSEIYLIASEAAASVSHIKGSCPHENSYSLCRECPEIG